MSNPEFHRILEEMGKLHDAKSADYGADDDPLSNFRGSERFGIPSWVGALVRATDKVARLETFAKKGTLKNESVEDSLLDLANYAVLALVLYREGAKLERKHAMELTEEELAQRFEKARFQQTRFESRRNH